ncbi:hypothetical protein BS329_37975 [Amycolatopsis coloradensis]|uniref:AbiEi antitoxin C-terminal domain-containing protein n=1 Tax=Amycolatopsis coloradensis TaxID=76021 RepID=A0A1R0KF71_9PSEU|nr:hypothetical protein [Amycolatopsis coloradensis]OLZ43840.1 hypothetical protein BS329_37975 [Amycolatopsis coloradensis]
MRSGEWARDHEALYKLSRDGVITVARLVEFGVPKSTCFRRCRPGRPWQRLLPGVLLLGSGRPTRRQLVDAALLYGGPGAIVTGLEACRRQGLKGPRLASDGVRLLVPASCKVSSVGYVTVERTTRMPRPVVVNGVAMAPLVRAALDECRRFTVYEPVRALLTEAVQRGGLGPEALIRELEAGSDRGSALPREVLSDVLGGARSVAEIDAMAVWRRTGLPEPQWNHELRDAGGRYIGTPDGYFRKVRLAWEIDSYDFHFARTRYAGTLERNSRYTAEGILVLQTLPSRLRSEPGKVAAELVAAYDAAGSRQSSSFFPD